MKILLDTCTILWTISEPEKLTQKSKELLTSEDSEICVSAISCAEIACATERGRIVLDQHWKKWFRYYLNLNKWHCFAIDLEIMEEAYSLPDSFHNDPADRIIVATARLLFCSIITADRKILDYPHVDAIW